MIFLSKLRYLFASRRPRGEFDEEMENHLALLAERFTAQGMAPAEALRAARRQFGNRTSLAETHQEMQTFVWLETLWQDVRYAARLLRRNLAFATVAVLTLALGIGANTAIFSVVNAAILRPLPYPDPGRLAILWGNVKRVRVERRGTTYLDFLDWRARSHRFEGMAAFDDHSFALTGVDNPEAIEGEYVSASYFSLLGIHPQLGRTFTGEEDRVPKRDAVVVLGDRLWKRRFSGDPAILGKTIQLDGSAYTVVGVAPAGFQGVTDGAELWAPGTMSGNAEELGSRRVVGWRVLARVQRGASMVQAQTEMDAIAKQLEQEYPRDNEARGVEVAPLEHEHATDFSVLVRTSGDAAALLPAIHAAVRQSEPSILVLDESPLADLAGQVVAAARFVALLMAIFAGFATFLAAIGIYGVISYSVSRRTREIGLRVALGSGRARVLRLVVGNGMALVIAGLVLGSAGALVLGRVLATAMQGLNSADPLAFAGASAVLALVALVACLLPAVRASRIDPAVALREQ